MASKTVSEIRVGDVVCMGGGLWIRVEKIRAVDDRRKLTLVGQYANDRGGATECTYSKNTKKMVR